MRGGRTRRRGALLAATASILLAGALAAPAVTAAAWNDSEKGSGVVTAGTVQPVTVMTCTAGLTNRVTFNWTAPVGGLTRSGYRWTVTGGLSGSGTIASTATSVPVTTGLLGIGTGTFSLYAQGPSGWESTVKTGTLTFATGLLSTCSVP